MNTSSPPPRTLRWAWGELFKEFLDQTRFGDFKKNEKGQVLVAPIQCYIQCVNIFSHFSLFFSAPLFDFIDTKIDCNFSNYQNYFSSLYEYTALLSQKDVPPFFLNCGDRQIWRGELWLKWRYDFSPSWFRQLY